MPGDHRRSEGVTRVRAAVPPAQSLNVLRNLKHAVHRLGGHHRGVGMPREAQQFGDEVHALAVGRSTFPGGRDVRGLGRHRGHRCCLGADARTLDRRRAAGGHDQRKEKRRGRAPIADGPAPSAGPSPSASARTGPSRPRGTQRTRFTTRDGLCPTAWPPVPVLTSDGSPDPLEPVAMTCTATFIVFFSGSPTAYTRFTAPPWTVRLTGPRMTGFFSPVGTMATLYV